MEAKTILVTGIGGNVGQGIIKNIRSMQKPLRVIGVNVDELSAGNHLVDAFYKVPFGTDVNYVPTLLEIVLKESVDLIIPSTDFEMDMLSRNVFDFNCKIACSEVAATEIYLDKYLTWKIHEKYNIAFAKSCLPSEYKGQYSKAIAKPRKGRGSKGLIFNIQDNMALPDDEYLIQELYEGIEITTTVYRSYLTSEIVGLISMERTLDNGATTYCRVNNKFDDSFLEIAAGIVSNIPVKGSFNIQSIVTNTGLIKPFEINCRISGTNSIRSNFNFKDVEYTVNELLYGIKPDKPEILFGTALRILTDIIYPSDNIDGQIIGNNKDNFIQY